MTESMKTDVLIAGGGMVGAALACALKQQGIAVALIEAREPKLEFDPEHYEIRVSAITRASQNILSNLGVWSDIREQRATAYEAMHVWDQAGFGEIHFDASDIAEPDIGHIIENNVIQSALWRRMQALEIEIICPDSIDTFDADTSRVKTAAGVEIEAQLVVAADGGRSQLRQLAGIGINTHNYQQSALVAVVKAELGNQSTAWQRFMPTGPLALLPMDDDKFSIVWTTSADQAELLKNLPEEEFDAALTQASENRLGELNLVGVRGVFPLQAQHAGQYVKPGLALVGDAAHVIHPLAGQGVNLGFLDVAQLVDVLVEARAHGKPLGELSVLRRYERARRGHNQLVQSSMTVFKQLFSNDVGPLRLLRNLGLGLANHLTPVRHFFERTALQSGEDLPSLARPRY